MFLKRKVILIALGILLAGLLVACGNEPDYPTDTPAAPGKAVPTGNTNTNKTANTNTTGTAAPSNPTAGTAKAARAGSAKPSDPCNLFTKDDFKSVFGKAATEPDRDSFPEWSSCNYGFDDPSEKSSDTAYGLDVRLLKGDFTSQKFEDNYQVLQDRLQKLSGVGDMAYLLPSVGADNAASLFVLKGTTSFTLSLLEPTSVSDAQKQTELKAAAQKILGRL